MAGKPELLAVILHLQAKQNCTLPATNGHMVRGAFYEMLRSSSADLSRSLHEANEQKPFTLSGLRGKLPLPGQKTADIYSSPVIPVVDGGNYWIRVTSLESEFSGKLMDVLASKVKSSLRIGAVQFQIAGYALHSHSRAGTTLYSRLMEECLSASTPAPLCLKWTFISATTFHSHKRNRLFPEPSTILAGLLKRWNHFCPKTCRLPHEGDNHFTLSVEQSLMVSANQLRTRMLDFGEERREIGFTGHVEYRPDKPADTELLKLFHLLGRFSFFSGIGYGTTKGMGQVKFILP